MVIVRTGNTHEDFRCLTAALDAELRMRYGAAQAEYDKHNRIAPIDTAVIGYVDGEPAACGCFKVMDAETVEMKRMFVAEGQRRRGHGRAVVRALEEWAAELGFARAVLETGKGQPEAIGLYRGMGYEVMENYGPYAGRENSVCMQKSLSPKV